MTYTYSTASPSYVNAMLGIIRIRDVVNFDDDNDDDDMTFGFPFAAPCVRVLGVWATSLCVFFSRECECLFVCLFVYCHVLIRTLRHVIGESRCQSACASRMLH